MVVLSLENIAEDTPSQQQAAFKQKLTSQQPTTENDLQNAGATGITGSQSLIGSVNQQQSQNNSQQSPAVSRFIYFY